MAEFNNSNDNMTPNQSGQGGAPNQASNQPAQGSSFANNPQLNGQNRGQFQQAPNMGGQPAQPQMSRPQQPQFNQNAQNFANQAPNNGAQQFQRPQQSQNVPPQAGQGPAGVQVKKTLSEEDKERLRKVNRDNADIKKLKKRVKKPVATENARPLYKVRRLYSAKISHRMYYEHMLELARLRALANEGGKKGAALIGTAAKKTRNLIATLLIVFAILAVVGTGTFVTITLLNNGSQDFDFKGDIELTEGELINKTISNYEFGKDIDMPITVKNSTGKELYLNLIIDVTPNENLINAIENENLNFKDLQFTPIYKDGFNDEMWTIEKCEYIETTKNGVVDTRTQRYYMYYNGKMSTDSNSASNTLSMIKGYKFTLAETATNQERWVINGRGVEVKFTINYVGVDAYNNNRQDSRLNSSWLNPPENWLKEIDK